jgi:transposase
LAFFDHASNGPTEAINGRLEALRRNALGFRNLTHYRIRSLLHSGDSTHSSTHSELRRARLRRPRGHGPTAEVRRSASIDVPVAPRSGTTAVTDDAAMSTNRDDLLDLSGLAATDQRGELVAIGAVAFGTRPIEVALHGAHRHR